MPSRAATSRPATSRPATSRAATSRTASTLRETLGTRSFTIVEVRDIGITVEQLRHAVAAGRVVDCEPMLWVPPDSLRPGVRHGVHLTAGDVPRESTVTTSDGMVVTSPLRTAIDVVRLARMPRAYAMATLIGGLRAHLATSSISTNPTPGAPIALIAHPEVVTRRAQDPRTRAQLADDLEVAVAASPSWGLRSVRSCLPFLDARVETALESLSWGRFVDAGIALPEPQAWLQGSSGRWWRVDFWWPELGVIGEADGMLKYTDPQVLTQEKARQLDLEGPGRSVFRWGWAHVMGTQDPLFQGLVTRISSRMAS